jgi:hypothetical protein
MHQCKQRKQSNCLMFIHSYYVSQIHGHIIFFQGHIINIASNYIVHISPKEVLSVGYIVILKVIELYATCNL